MKKLLFVVAVVALVCFATYDVYAQDTLYSSITPVTSSWDTTLQDYTDSVWFNWIAVDIVTEGVKDSIIFEMGMRRMGEVLWEGTIGLCDSLSYVFTQCSMSGYYFEYDSLDYNRDGVVDDLDVYDLNRSGVWDISDLMQMVDRMFR